MPEAQVALLQVLLVASSAAYLAVGVRLRKYADEPAGTPIVVLVVLSGLAGLLFAVSAVPGVKSPWLVRGYVPLYLLPVAWAVFVLEYVGYSRSRSRRVVPLVSGLAFGGAAFNLFVWGREVEGLLFVVLSIGNVLALVVLLFVAGLGVGSVLLLLWSARRQTYVGLQRAVLLAAGGGGPWVLAVAAVQTGTLVGDGGLAPAVPWAVLGVGFAGCVAALLAVVRRGRLFERLPAPGNVGPDTVFRQLTEPVVVLSRDEQVVRANPAAESTFAGNGGSVVGLALDGVIGVDLETVRSSSRLEHTVDGERREFEHSVTDLTDQHGRVVGHAVLLSDVTEREGRKQRIAELSRTRAELERKNERLDQFASVVSHDLRNPLSVAQGYLDLARETNDEEDFESVAAAHDRMERMIDEMLTLARAETTVDATEPVLLPELVESAWATAETPGADLRGDVPWGFELVADAGLLSHVFENLFRNAAEHNDPPLTVRVGILGPADEPTGFYVADDGTGIPPDDRETVFEHGYSSQDDGTGFGLSIVREFVRAHGWEIRVVESDEGGARFEVTGIGSVT